MILLLLSGCQTIDLAQEWELDRLRLLAIRAEPAEPVPGDTVTFTSLSHVPGGVDSTAIWFACVAGTGAGCAIDPSVLEGMEDVESMTPEEQAELFAALQEAGLIGAEPFWAPTWVVPEDALDGLSEEETLEGLAATVQVTLATEDDTELVLRSIPVSRATTPNTNPDVAAFIWDGEELVAGEPITAIAGQSYELEAAVAALEEYIYVTTDGATETRTEELEWRWYTSGGTIGGAYEIPIGDDAGEHTSVSTTWTAPTEEGDYVVHAVVLDGRGGMGWWSVTVTVLA